MPEFSIIIPFFNTPIEKFNRCINSIIEQTYDSFEIIIVDDGSTNEYALKIDDIAKKDIRIKILHKKNEGSSVARNEGIHLACGKYIGFIDSDDFILPNTLKEAENAIISYNPDVVFGLMQRQTNNDLILDDTNKESTFEMFYYNTKEDIDDFANHILGKRLTKYFFNNGYIADSPCARFYRSSLVKETKFSAEGYCDDDTVWNLMILPKCKNFVIVNDIWYIYMIYEASKTRRFRPNSLYEIQYRCKQEYELVKENFPNAKEGVYIRIWSLTAVLGRTFLYNKSNKCSLNKKIQALKDLINYPVYNEMLQNISFKKEKLSIGKILKEINRYCSLHGFIHISYFIWYLYIKKNV